MFRLILLMAGWVSLIGCGSDAPPTGAVRGTITFAGEPVTNASVLFQSPEHGWIEYSPLDADGNYSIENANVGSYVVSIEPPEPDMPDETSESFGESKGSPSPASDPSNIPQPFRMAHTSPLTAEVKAGENTFDFDLANELK